MEIVVDIISIAAIALAMFVLLKYVWQTKFDFRELKLYVAIICSLLVAGSIYISFHYGLASFVKYSTREGFKEIISVFAAIIPFLAFLPIARFCLKRKLEAFTAFNIIFQTVIVLFILAISISLNSIWVYLLSGVLMILAIVSFVVRNQNKYFNSVTKINEDLLNAQLNHYEAIKQSNFELRRIKHDMKNHLLVIKELAATGKASEVSSYADELLGEIAASETFYRTGNEIVDAIISDKKAKAGKRGINLEVTGNIVGCEINPVDLCTIIANLLDNAIEAVSKLYGLNTSEKHNAITLDFKKNANFVLITETNYAIARMREENNRIISSKGGSDHGFGIYNIKNAVYRNGGEFNCSVKEEEFFKFEFEIMLPLN